MDVFLLSILTFLALYRIAVSPVTIAPHNLICVLLDGSVCMETAVMRHGIGGETPQCSAYFTSTFTRVANEK